MILTPESKLMALRQKQRKLVKKYMKLATGNTTKRATLCTVDLLVPYG
jgi:hypothetical protein